MTSIAILEAVNTSYVPFNGQQILTAMAAGVAYVAMRPVVENLGLDWATQLRKLRGGVGNSNRRDISIVDDERGCHMTTPSKFGCCDISIPSKGGIQKMLCIPLKKLNGWLFSINPEKVRADIRDKLIQYQEECFTVLHDYWTKGKAENPRKTQQSTAKQLTPLRQTAERLIATGMGRIYPDIWKFVHQHFEIEHINQLKPSQISEAVTYLDALEGEFLGKQEELPAPKLNLPDITMEWWYSNNFPMRIDNLERYPGHQAWNDLTITPPMMYGKDTKSPALYLIEILERMGFDMVGPRIEVETMRIMLGKGKQKIRVMGDGRVKYLLSL